MSRQSATQRSVSRALVLVAVGMLAFVNLLPIVWGFATSLKTPTDVFVSPPQMWGFTPTGENYANVIRGSFGRAFFTSILYALGTTVVGLAVTLVGAYALDRLRFPGRRFVFYAMVACVPLAIGAAVLVVPNYIYFATLGWTNKWYTLPLLYLALHIPLSTWVIKGSIEGIPTELDQAGKIDGLSNMGVLFRIILPLCRPAMFAAGILIFIGAWNEFLAGSVMVRDAEFKPVQVAVYQYITAFGRHWGPLTASAILAVVPMLLLLVFSGRHLVNGLMRGSVKG